MKFNGERHYLCRAGDHEGEVLESYVSKRRDRKSALKALRKSMKRHSQSQIIATGKLRSYGLAMKDNGNAKRGGNRSLAEQPSREFTLAVSTTRTRNATVSAHAKFVDVRRRPLFRP